MNNFSKLGLSERTVKALNHLNFVSPTEIQQKAIPILLEQNCNFLGLAQTGTGKTAAFGLPLIDLIDTNKREIQALIITPTRELGQQISEQLKLYSQFQKNIRIEVVYGGKPIDKQISYLRKKPAIVVATPGRLLDLLGRKALNLKYISNVILDEADEMLNMGFEEDIDKILSLTPPYKKIWLFSATMPAEIQKIANNYMQDYQEVRINSEVKVNADIRHEYIRVKAPKKFEALLKILEEDEDMRAVIFCRTRRDTQQLAEDLIDAGYSAGSIHGDLSQHQRDRVMNRFKTNRMRFLTATDVAARGIDVKDLSHVIHYALPEQMEYYTHRSGRTARAGKTGISISLLTGAEFSRMKLFSKDLQIVFEESELQPLFEFDTAKQSDKKSSGRNNRRDNRRGGRRDGRRGDRRDSGRETRSENRHESRNESRGEFRNENKRENRREDWKENKREKPRRDSKPKRESKFSRDSKPEFQNSKSEKPKRTKRKRTVKSKSSFAGSSYDMPPRGEKRQTQNNKYRQKVEF